MRQIQIVVTLLLLSLVGCNNLSAASRDLKTSELTVFAAASLTEAFTAIAEEFEAGHPGVEVLLNFAGSQTLRVQIEQGARADVFASANQQHTDALLAAGFIEPPQLFAHNQLVVITPATNPASVQTLADLTQPGLKLILAGPAVPVGRYARLVLENLDNDPTLGPDFSTRVLTNLISEEDNVKGIVAKIQLDEADVGMVYISDVIPSVADDVATLPIPAEYNVVADYPIAVVADSNQPDLAQQFINFVRSAEGQAILTAHGLQPIQLHPPGQKP
jgi:molybdate transport system substrate-binding protein